MKNYVITVNGTSYDVTVEENAAGVSAPAAPVKKAAPVAAPKAAAPAAGSRPNTKTSVNRIDKNFLAIIILLNILFIELKLELIY